MNEDMKHIKKRLKDALNQKFPNFKVAYSYVDDIKNLTERKKYIVEHNKTITSIIYDRYLQFILTGDIMDKTEAG
jgi:disulfide oxidoreductase YuzD